MCKDSERQAQWQSENKVFGIDRAERPPCSGKDNERRQQEQKQNAI